jgi:hypothetical protein
VFFVVAIHLEFTRPFFIPISLFAQSRHDEQTSSFALAADTVLQQLSSSTSVA